MSDCKKTASLTNSEVSEIQKQALAKIGECRKANDVIGVQIFSILSLYARVIYYPLGQDAPWGFTHMSGIQNTIVFAKPFIAINSAIPVDCQVFAAAHELYHIWYEGKADIIPATVLDERIQERNELKANRFAAEFLVDASLLRQEMDLYSIKAGGITLKDVLRLAELFTVPYRTMVKRLNEINAIDQKTRDDYLSITNTIVAKLRKRYSLSVPEADNKITIDNLVELAFAMFEKKRITYEKFEYLLKLSGLKSEDVGIQEPAEHDFPSDAELDSIMEE